MFTIRYVRGRRRQRPIQRSYTSTSTNTNIHMFRHFIVDDRFNSSGPILKCYLKETVYEDAEWIRWSPVPGSVNKNDFRRLINQN